MQVKRVAIKPQDYDKVVHIDASANHWALEHAKHTAAAQDALATFRDLSSAKNQVVTEMVKASGVADMRNVVQARLVKDAEGAFVEVAIQEDPEPAAAEPAPPPAEAPAS